MQDNLPQDIATELTNVDTNAPEEELSVKEILKFALIVLAIVIPIRLFVAEPFIVSGLSMDPTFENGQYLIVDRLSYKLEAPQRGDVVIFRYPKDPKKYFIKRIIALPNESIQILNQEIYIKNSSNPDGFLLKEPFLNVKTNGDTNVTLKENEYFVMGDNRNMSSDSRYWGVLPKENIIGRAFLRLIPLTKVGIFPGEEHTSQK